MLAKKCAAPLTRRSARLPEWRRGKGVRYAPFPLSAIMRGVPAKPVLSVDNFGFTGGAGI